MTFFRTHSRFVLGIMLVLGVGFLFYGSGNFSNIGGSPTTDFGRIDGENLQVADLYNAVRTYRGMLVLQGRDDQVPQAQIAENAWQELLALHEAEKLHIDVTDDQVLTAIQSQPEFQKDGVYSPDQYRNAMTMLQNVKHISADAYTGIVRNQLRTAALARALFSSIHAVGAGAKEEYEKEYGPVELSYIVFPASAYTATEKIAPKDIEDAYKADPANPAYRTDEKRQVEYVLFPLTADQQKLPQKDKDAAIQALGQKAIDFALSLQPDPNAPAGNTPPPIDFDAQAKKSGLTPVTTAPFTATTPPAGMAPSPAFNNAAFALSQDDPVGKPVQMDNGVAVEKLVKIEPSELKPLAEVTPQIEKELQAKQAKAAQQVAAALAASALQEAVKKGADFKTAAAAQHLTVQTLPAFVPRTVSMKDMKQATLGFYSARLPVGAVSPPIPLESENSVLVLHVDGRNTADVAGFADFEKSFRQSQDQELREKASFDWITWLGKQPGNHRPPNLEAYGGVTD